jgi:hypothetical protein
MCYRRYVSLNSIPARLRESDDPTQREGGMAEMPPDRGLGPDRRSPGMPRWVKVGIVVFVALVLLLVILTVAGVHEPQPGGHGP